MFIHVIQKQNFDVLAQPYGIYTKPFRGGCLVDGRRDTDKISNLRASFNMTYKLLWVTSDVGCSTQTLSPHHNDCAKQKQNVCLVCPHGVYAQET